MSQPSRPIGLLGGTFDPVHYGHLRIAQELYEAVGLAEVRFIPSATPPHKSHTHVQPAQRLAMLKLAVGDNAAFTVDEREYRRSGPSYTIDTLTEFRSELPTTPLCLIIGSDSFFQLDTWRRWRELTQHCHLIVAMRPGCAGDAGAVFDGFFRDAVVSDVAELRQSAQGKVLLWQVTQLDIAATRIRQQLASGHSVRYLLPDNVWEYIQTNKLYRG